MTTAAPPTAPPTAAAEDPAPQNPPADGAGPPSSDLRPAPRARTAAGAVDLAVLVLLLAATAVGFGPAWADGTWVIPAAGGALVGLAVAWCGAVRRWSALTVVAVSVVAYLVFGGALALPATTIAGVVPTGSTLQALLAGSVTVWKDAVTAVPPLGVFPELAVLPYLLMLVTALVAGTIAWRAPQGAWAIVAPATALIVVILVGTDETAFPILQGVVLAVVGLLWASWRVTERRLAAHAATLGSHEAGRRLRRHRAVRAAVLLVVASGVAVLLVPWVQVDDRVVLREEIVPPPEIHEFVTPLVEFRTYVNEEADTEMLTVEGMPEGARVRLATLDAYDGTVYGAAGPEDATDDSGVFHRTGGVMAAPAVPGPKASVDVTIQDYRGPWLPDVGYVTSIDYGGPRADALIEETYYNAVSGTLIAAPAVRAGDTYRLNVVVPPGVDQERLDDLTILQRDLPRPQNLPDSVPAKAAQFVGDATDPGTRLARLRDAVVGGGIYSSGLGDQLPSRPGHGADRIDTLLAGDEMIGDDEQYAVAVALMAQQVGIPARVVMGFVPPDDWTAGTPFVATGGDVRAWIEVPVEGGGWVPVDVTPDEDTQVQPEPKTEEVPKPPVIDDPEPPVEPEAEDAASAEREDEEEVDADAFTWGPMLVVASVILVPLVVLLLPLILVLAAKARRRTRRREAEDPVDRFSGGWSEVLDAATDLGAPVPRGATRSESATYLTGQFSQAPSGTLTALAGGADRTVFSGTAPAAGTDGLYWDDVDAAVGGMRASVGRRRRWRAKVSLRSLRAERRRHKERG